MLRERRMNQRLFYGGLIASLILLLAGWWAGSGHLLSIPGGRLVVLGRLFGLLATYAILLEIFLMSRSPFIEKNFDLHEIVDLHRLNGYGILAGIAAHVVFITLGYATPGHAGLWHQFVFLNVNYEDVFIATLGTLLFFAAGALSMRVARNRLPYELWFFSHLLMYGAVVMVTLHQLKTGGDFIGHFWFTAYWYMGYIGVFGAVAWYRFLRPAALTFLHDFRIARVEHEANDIYSVYITGRNIKRFHFKPGQYATWWILTPGAWWQGHPFSFSSMPGEPYLRFTAKTSGDFTQTLAGLKPGTRVAIDGPRGSFTIDRASDAAQVVLVAGGIGVAPYLAAIDALLRAGKSVTLLYAARSPADVSFSNELLSLKQRGLRVQIFTKNRGKRIDGRVLQTYARPGTVVYVCGPDSMSRSLTNILRQLGLPRHAIITERFAY